MVTISIWAIHAAAVWVALTVVESLLTTAGSRQEIRWWIGVLCRCLASVLALLLALLCSYVPLLWTP